MVILLVTCEPYNIDIAAIANLLAKEKGDALVKQAIIFTV